MVTFQRGGGVPEFSIHAVSHVQRRAGVGPSSAGVRGEVAMRTGNRLRNFVIEMTNKAALSVGEAAEPIVAVAHCRRSAACVDDSPDGH